VNIVGRHLIAVVEESVGRVGFYDSSQGFPLAHVAVGSLPHEIAISDDGITAYVSNFGVQDYDEHIGTPGCSISIIDLCNLCEVGRLFTFDPNKPELYVNVEQGSRILVFDIHEKNLKKVFQLPQLQPFSSEPFENNFPALPGTHNCVFSKDGNHLFLFAGRNGVYRMNADTGQITGKYEQTSIRGLVFMPDHSALIGSGINESVLLHPEHLGLIRRYSDLGVQQILYSDVTPDGKLIIAPAVWDSQAIVLNTDDGMILKRVITGLDPVYQSLPEGKVRVRHQCTEQLRKSDRSLELSLTADTDRRRSERNSNLFVPAVQTSQIAEIWSRFAVVWCGFSVWSCPVYRLRVLERTGQRSWGIVDFRRATRD
jgi:hypothetical protein